MRTQTLHDDVDERSWRLPQVDPTGWLVGRSGTGSGSVVLDPSRPTPGTVLGVQPNVQPTVEPGARRLRRPRRTEAARAARERDLARRRRRRHGRTVAVEHQVGPAGATSSEWAARPVWSIGRVADPVGRTERAAPDSGYRIGRWGRLALSVLAAATLAVLIGRLVTLAMAGATAPDLVDVTVRPGDTLWSIASSASPDRDPRSVIDDIRELNEISGNVVRVGEVVRVPTSSG